MVFTLSQRNIADGNLAISLTGTEGFNSGDPFRWENKIMKMSQLL